MISSLSARLAEFCRRHAAVVTLAAIGSALACGIYVGGTIRVDTDTFKLISGDIPWRREEIAFDRAFPHTTDRLTIVIDARSPDLADAAAGRLAQRLSAHRGVLNSVLRPDGGAFFERHGFLFLSVDELQTLSEELIKAQPMIGALAADPSSRGLFSALQLALDGVITGEASPEALERPLGMIAKTAESVLNGNPQPLSWRRLFLERQIGNETPRRFITAQVVRDFSRLASGAAAAATVRAAADELGLTPVHGFSVRLTGSVPLADEELATVAEGAEQATLLSIALVCVLLFLALRSGRMIAAVLITLMIGLVLTAAFATATLGSLNIISVAFAALFIGIAVDFSIQYGVRYLDERRRRDGVAEAIGDAASRIGGPLLLAAATTAIGFFSFVPTDYVGVAELGLIAGVGMLIAITLNLTVFPALLGLFRPPGAAAAQGYPWAAGIDERLLRHRKPIVVVALAFAGIGFLVAPQLRFDFNPLNLKDPRSESVATLNELIADPATSPFTINVLAPAPAAAERLAERLAALPEVERAVTLMSFVPKDQDEKLAILDDLSQFLEPALASPAVLPPPTSEEVMAGLAAVAAKLRRAYPPSGFVAMRLAGDLDAVRARGREAVSALDQALVLELPRQLDLLRAALQAKAVDVASLPPEIVNEWLAADGRARILVSPRGDVGQNEAMARFVDAVRSVAPNATGAPISFIESSRSIIGAFIRAAIYAFLAIVVVLWLVLRRWWDVLLVLAPVILAALLTVSTSVIFDIPLNFANIIALPMMLGIGVAFSIYFVINWRAGVAGPLQSPTARAIVFSALTTAAAFGSLAVSSHPGTASMGLLLAIGLAFTVATTLFMLPALMGPARRRGAS